VADRPTRRRWRLVQLQGSLTLGGEPAHRIVGDRLALGDGHCLAQAAYQLDGLEQSHEQVQSLQVTARLYRHNGWKNGRNSQDPKELRQQAYPFFLGPRREVLIPAPKEQMGPDDAIAIAAQLMSAFASRTGLYPASENQQRYLWTDAFAVCNFLELFERTGDELYRRCATALIDKVHQVLGRYRPDDVRQGWISGPDQNEGRHHPTKGGLRIGKPLKERPAGEPIDDGLEWDRDGQYFHYLTKWMHALCRAAFVANDPAYVEQALELETAAFNGFVHRSASGDAVGIYWKMSTDLSRPLTYAMGLHDALDGFITFRVLQQVSSKVQPKTEVAGLDPAIETLQKLCRNRNWTTDDPLGIGGLLFDACRLSQLTAGDAEQELLEQLTDASEKGLLVFLASQFLMRPASHRLAFRELGLAIGLRAAPTIIDRTRTRDQYRSLAGEIVNTWLPIAHSPDELWQAHRDINEVMLATALIPETFLSVVAFNKAE